MFRGRFRFTLLNCERVFKGVPGLVVVFPRALKLGLI